jgi:hypothetical protein
MNITINKPTINFQAPPMASALLAALMASTYEDTKATPHDAAEHPQVGEYWPAQGGVYVGSRLINGTVHHVVIADVGTLYDSVNQNHKEALHTRFGEIDGHDDWHAGDQADHMLAFMNAREHFKEGDSVYWTRTEHNGWACAFNFENGSCSFERNGEFRVRPFRRFIY